MKEFLEPHPNGNYAFVKAESSLHPSWIEIPDGSECAVLGNDGNIYFWKSHCFIGGIHKEWVDMKFGHDAKWYLKSSSGSKIIWQRSETEYLMQGKNGERLMESVGQLKGVEATLAQRQDDYGCFEDVAFVTENIMSILAKVRVNGLQDLPNTHRMALYMIASKMARIVNGDFNKLDSWHDIGGYAKLIENLIEGK